VGHDTGYKSQVAVFMFAGGRRRCFGRERTGDELSILLRSAGLLPWPAYTHYCVSKAGVIHADALHGACLGAGKITVNAVAPGTISFPGDAPEIAENFIRRAPLHRTGGPERY